MSPEVLFPDGDDRRSLFMNIKHTAKKVCAYSIAAVLTVSCLLTGEPAVADTMSDLEAKQTKLNQQLKDAESELAKYKSQAEESEEYLKEYDNKMKLQEEQVENIQQQIELCEADIVELENEVEAKQKEVDEGIEQFKQRIRVLYMSGNDSMASVLAGSTNFYDMLARMEFVERVSKHDNDLIDGLNEQITELEADKAELEQRLEELETKKAEKEAYYEELRETYNNHAETKKMQEAKAEDYRQRANEIEAEQQKVEEELQAEIRRLQEEAERKRKEEEERRRKEEEERRKAAEAAQAEYVPQEVPPVITSYSETGFIWPVPTVRNMTDGYGYRTIDEEGGRSDLHKGIDITKPGCGGTPVVASAGGTVIQAGDKGNGYGNCVIIDHGGGISTLYAHNSSLAVSVGDNVVQGQTISYIGHTGYAYGDHCHFEVRVNGQHTNPLNYVNINN